MLSSATLGDALAVLERYWSLFGMGLSLYRREEFETIALEFDLLPHPVRQQELSEFDSSCKESTPRRTSGSKGAFIKGPVKRAEMMLCIYTVYFSRPNQASWLPGSCTARRPSIGAAVAVSPPNADS